MDLEILFIILGGRAVGQNSFIDRDSFGTVISSHLMHLIDCFCCFQHQVQCHLGLWQEKITQMMWEIVSYISEDGGEVSFKCLNCSLRYILPVHVRRDELELNFTPVSIFCLVLLATFIVQNV